MSVVNTDAAQFAFFSCLNSDGAFERRRTEKKGVRNAMRQRNIKSNKYIRAARHRGLRLNHIENTLL